jgi:hypothetical protein
MDFVASMKTRPSHSIASQFASQAWFSHRALLPPCSPSITRPSDNPNRNVWPACPVRRERRTAFRHAITSPLYSKIRSPGSSGHNAKTPLPWTRDRLTVIRRMLTLNSKLVATVSIVLPQKSKGHPASPPSISTRGHTASYRRPHGHRDGEESPCAAARVLRESLRCRYASRARLT